MATKQHQARVERGSPATDFCLRGFNSDPLAVVAVSRNTFERVRRFLSGADEDISWGVYGTMTTLGRRVPWGTRVEIVTLPGGGLDIVSADAEPDLFP